MTVTGEETVRLVVVVDIANATPRELRERWICALRESVMAARAADRIDLPTAEELIRALPERGRA